MTQRQGIAALRKWLRETQTAQAALARRLGVSPGTVSRWLAGERKPDVDCALKLEAVTGIPVAAFHPGVVRAA